MNGQQPTADLDVSVEEQHRISNRTQKKREPQLSPFYFYLFTFALV